MLKKFWKIKKNGGRKYVSRKPWMHYHLKGIREVIILDMATEGLPPKKGFCLDWTWRIRMRKEFSLLSQMFQMNTQLWNWLLYIWTLVLWPKNWRIKKKGAKNSLVPLSSGSNCQHSLDHIKIKGITEKHLILLHWLC